MIQFKQFLSKQDVPDLEKANKELEDILGFSPLTPTQFKDARDAYKQYLEDTNDTMSWEVFLALSS